MMTSGRVYKSFESQQDENISRTVNRSFPSIDMADKETQVPMAAKAVGPNEEAQHAADDEKSMGLMQAIKLYPKAVGWSVVLSSALIMEGYDLALLGSLYGSPQFNRKYGVFNPATNKYTVPANWQSAL